MMDWATEMAHKMAHRYSFEEIVLQLKEQQEASSSKKIYVNVLIHFTMWGSTGQFKDQVNLNTEYIKLLLEEIVKRPGAGIGLHFEIFDYEACRQHRPEAYKLIQQCIENKSLDVVAGGFVDYNCTITGLSDLDRHHRRWREYIEREFKVSTDGVFTFPNELPYHPNLPKVWKRNSIAGIVLFPFQRQLRQFNFEPLYLESNAGKDDKSVVISTLNTDSKLFDARRFAYTIDEKHTWQYRYLQCLELGAKYSSSHLDLFDKPIFCLGHDMHLFKPKELGLFLDAVMQDDVLELVSLRDYIKVAEPKRSIYLDQGGWDTEYEWERSSEGWFTQQPWCLHINGLAHKAHEDYEAARWLASENSDKGFRARLMAAEEGLLYSQRSTSRIHWSHPDPRRWCQEKALASIKASCEIIEQSLADRLNGDDAGFVLANRYAEDYAGLVCLNLEGADDTSSNWEVCNASTGEVHQAQTIRDKIDPVSDERVTQLLFDARLNKESLSRFTLRALPNQADRGIGIVEKNGMLSAKNEVIEITWDLNRGGRIAHLAALDRPDRILNAGDIFLGRTLEKKFAGADHPDVELKADLPGVSWRELTNGPGYALVEISAPISPEVGTKTVQYLIDKSSPVVRMTYRFFFSSPLWFPWEYDRCARLLFEADVIEPRIRWNMPGGWLRLKYPTDGWAGFDTFGAVLLGNEEKGVSLVSKLYPNGVRMALCRRKVFGFSFSGIQRLVPYHLSNANIGPCAFELAIVPNKGFEDTALTEQVYREYNQHLQARVVGDNHMSISVPEQEVAFFDEERFQTADKGEQYKTRVYSTLVEMDESFDGNG